MLSSWANTFFFTFLGDAFFGDALFFPRDPSTFSGTLMCSTLLCGFFEGPVVPNLRFGTTGSLTLGAPPELFGSTVHRSSEAPWINGTRPELRWSDVQGTIHRFQPQHSAAGRYPVWSYPVVPGVVQ